MRGYCLGEVVGAGIGLVVVMVGYGRIVIVVYRIDENFAVVILGEYGLLGGRVIGILRWGEYRI